MTNKELAEFAKANGYKYIARIVKSVFNTKYYHVHNVDAVLDTGKFKRLEGYKMGTIESELPELTITSTELRAMYKKER